MSNIVVDTVSKHTRYLVDDNLRGAIERLNVLNLCIFSAQLKFIPLPSIFENCKKYIGEGQLLTIPVNIRVADQVEK